MKVRVFIILFSLFTFFTTNAQCAMCRAVLESEDGQSTAKGVNDGIVYLMVIPYVLVAGMGLVMYTKFYKKKKV
ncbi:hypothetical protein [Gelidibacter pelagius]|uniref:Uncharacterized protein n=1 Tax=Gelidibacter pelagius TaxID=2819985 RepID=A0ABS3SN33_9FLAO|nr:hypothetical protein [Gelidibacter pelagius]MBO3097119.1 hypothetical protein [Gelidibacter pelagius]